MRKVVITGCSGGGKSTLLDELFRRGHAVVKEPGRRVIAAEHASGGNGFPWEDQVRFSTLAFWMAVGDHGAADIDPTFFDRSALDQAAWFEREGKVVPGEVPRYDRNVFLTPPWEAQFAKDEDRRHSFDEAVVEYDDLLSRLPRWGYLCHILPKVSVKDRADWLLLRLGATE